MIFIFFIAIMFLKHMVILLLIRINLTLTKDIQEWRHFMDKSSLPQHLKDLRKEYGYTQKFIAAYLNMTRQAYSNYETGKRTPDYNTLTKLSQLYNIQIDHLLKDTEINLTKSDGTLNRYENITKKEQTLLILFSQLSASEQDDFIAFLEAKVRSSTRK